MDSHKYSNRKASKHISRTKVYKDLQERSKKVTDERDSLNNKVKALNAKIDEMDKSFESYKKDAMKTSWELMKALELLKANNIEFPPKEVAQAA